MFRLKCSWKVFLFQPYYIKYAHSVLVNSYPLYIIKRNWTSCHLVQVHQRIHIFANFQTKNEHKLLRLNQWHRNTPKHSWNGSYDTTYLFWCLEKCWKELSGERDCMLTCGMDWGNWRLLTPYSVPWMYVLPIIPMLGAVSKTEQREWWCWDHLHCIHD